MNADLFSLHGSVALVTGAFGGLGRHFAGVLAAAGAAVALAGRRIAEGEAAARELRDRGSKAVAVTMDVADADSVAAAFDAAERALGPVGVVVNNAGIAQTQTALDVTERDWQQVIDVNLSGAFRVAQAAARRMQTRGGGSIVNIASILGLRVAQQIPAYCASKAALLQLTQALALEWARHGIRVNALAPGYVASEINRTFFDSDAGQALVRRIPQRRLGQPHELDGALLLLASRASTYMTGSVIAIDGGHLVSSL